MHTIQVPLLPFNDLLRLNHHDRLLTVLQALPAEALLRTLEVEHPGGRRGYPPRALTKIALSIYRRTGQVPHPC